MKTLTSKTLTALAILAIGFSSCKKDEIKDDKYTIPTTYEGFENVSYSGQTDRLNMLAAMSTEIKKAHVVGADPLSATKLVDMYKRQNNAFDDATLNSSSKELFNKTWEADTTLFTTILDSAAAASAHTSATASNGVPGILASADGKKKYLFNSKGVELVQIFEKGLMGACFKYQATAKYFGEGKMGVDVDNEKVTDGKGTDMEHHFDEAFGYFGAPKDFPSNDASTNKFWAKYTNTVNGAYTSINKTMMDAFLKGRAAITNKDLTTRDEQITILRKNWEIAAAGAAIHYINDAIGHLTTATADQAKALHEMSEAYAFIMCLKYGVGAGAITTAHVNTILTDAFGNSNPLEANLYNTTIAKLEAARTAIVSHITELDSVKETL